MNQWSLWVLTLHTSFLGHLVISSHERESHEDVHPKGPAHFHWNYEDESHWDAHYSFCGGREQSPINIETRTIKYNPSLKPILLSGYNMSSGEMLTLKNNGHTVVLDLPSNLEIIGGLPQTYRAVQLHFHWGSKSSPGSEHTVNGERFHGEIHVVHYSTEYENISEAQTYPGGLAVLAAFIQEGPDQNPTYDHILSYFEEVNEDGESIQIPGFNIRGLLPERMDRYYRYNGSLTTPPCFQSVNWTIFNQTIALSKNQLSILEDTIHIDQHHILQKNFRKPQKLNTRLVFSSFRQAVGGRRGAAPGSEDAHSGQEAHQEAAAMTTGDMLAIIFGILFMVTAVAFFVYVRRSKKQRSGSENKSNVIYKAATTEENLA